MGDELTGVTLGGFGGRSPHPLLSFSCSSPSVSLPFSLHWRSVVSHAAVVVVAVKRGKNSAWCFSEQVPPAATPNNGNYRHHQRLKQASLRPEGLA